MQCHVCKKENKEGGTFCSHCGKPLSKPGLSDKTDTVHVSSERSSPGGPIHLGDTGMIKDSTLHSESHVDSNDHIETHIDSHDQIGAPAVGGSVKIKNILNIPAASQEKVRPEHCPICGSVVREDYFRCKACGRNHLCKDHMDRRELVCFQCASRLVNAEEPGQEGWNPISARQLEETIDGDSAGKPASEHRPPSGWDASGSNDPYDKTGVTISDRPSQSRKILAVAGVVIAVGVGIYLGYPLFFSSKEPPKQVVVTGPPAESITPTSRSTSAIAPVQPVSAPHIPSVPPVSSTPPPPSSAARVPLGAISPSTSSEPVSQGKNRETQAATVAATQKSPAVLPATGIRATGQNLPPEDKVMEAALTLEVNIIGQRKIGSGYEEVFVKNGGTLKTDDNLKIYIKPSRNCFIYVLVFDSEGTAGMLFPDPRIGMDNRVKGGATYQIPDGTQWFYLDERTGRETIYVLASLVPMSDIDRLLLSMETKKKHQQQEDTKKILASADVLKKGVRGIKLGPSHQYKTSDADEIQSVTQIVEGTGSVVWLVSFQHVDK
jgi:hypothetical protein